MPIELLNGNERFVVFNISKIIPGGARIQSEKRAYLRPKHSTPILIFMRIFASVSTYDLSPISS